MPKLKLDLDALQVDSFATDANGAAGGTVHAHVTLGVTHCPVDVKPGPHDTEHITQVTGCVESCGGTCPASCGGTCFPASCACYTVEFTCKTCLVKECNPHGPPQFSGAPGY